MASPVLVYNDTPLFRLEIQAAHEWSMKHNCSQYASGAASYDLGSGKTLRVYAGWNCEKAHDATCNHVPAGRSSSACLDYFLFTEGRFGADRLTRDEAVASLRAAMEARG